MQTAKITEKNGSLAGLMTVKGDEDLMIITDTGVMIRTNVANISQTGRSTMGVKVMRLDQDAKIDLYYGCSSRKRRSWDRKRNRR